MDGSVKLQWRVVDGEGRLWLCSTRPTFVVGEGTKAAVDFGGGEKVMVGVVEAARRGTVERVWGGSPGGGGVRPTWECFSRAVDEGVAYGWNRAHKHTDTPTPEAVREAIERAVMDALAEVIEWPDFE